MSKRCTQMNQNAMGLSDLSLKLRDMISVFKVSAKDEPCEQSSGLSETPIPELDTLESETGLEIDEMAGQQKTGALGPVIS